MEKKVPTEPMKRVNFSLDYVFQEQNSFRILQPLRQVRYKPKVLGRTNSYIVSKNEESLVASESRS